MSILKRFAFYFGGFAIGLVLLFFFVGGSGAKCEFDYSPNARVLKNIRIKERIISKQVLSELKENELDTSFISFILNNGDVLFSESNTKLDSCKIYRIKSDRDPSTNKTAKITVENCNKEVTINDIEFISK